MEKKNSRIQSKTTLGHQNHTLNIPEENVQIELDSRNFAENIYSLREYCLEAHSLREIITRSRA